MFSSPGDTTFLDIWNPQFDRPILSSGNNTTLTTGMLLLWTLGTSIHTAYNLVQWHIAACACCRSGGMCERRACCPSLGKHLLKVLVIVIISMAVLIVFTRVAISNAQEEEEEMMMAQQEPQFQSTERTEGDTTTTDSTKDPDSIHFFDDDTLEYGVHDASEFKFLVGYCIELVLALFVYYPIGGTIFFAGWLGCCGRIPLLGGRPYEVAMEEKKFAQRTNPTMDEDTSEDPEDGGVAAAATAATAAAAAVKVEHYQSQRFR